MNKALPDKWVRRAISNAINGMVVDGVVIKVYDYRATGVDVSDYYVLMTVQSNEVDKNNKCEYFWDSEILLDIVVKYLRPGNIGSRLFADNILDSVRTNLLNFQLDVASNLEVINQSFSFPNDLNFVSDSEIVFRKFLRLKLKIK